MIFENYIKLNWMQMTIDNEQTSKWNAFAYININFIEALAECIQIISSNIIYQILYNEYLDTRCVAVTAPQ